MTKKGNESGHDLEQTPEIIFNPGYADSGNASERELLVNIGTGQDISKAAKTTLGNYLSSATAGNVNKTRPNSFRIDAGSVDLEESGGHVNVNTHSDVTPVVAKQQMQSAGSTIGSFIDLSKGYGSNAGDKFDDLKHSEYVKRSNPFKDTIIKRIDSEDRRKGFDGHSLLPSIKGTQTATDVDLGNPDISPPPETQPLVQQKISEV